MSGHQPGSLKQANKKHKASTSKRQNKVTLGAGKVETAKRSVLKQKKGKTNNEKLYQKDSRINRVHKLDQLRKNKKSDIWLSKRVGSDNGAPKIIGVIPLSNISDPLIALQSCLIDASWSDALDSETLPTNVHAFYSQHKSRCTFVAAKHDLFSALDVAKVADILLFVVDSQVDNILDLVDSTGRNIISAIKATGCPEMLCCVTSIDDPTTNMDDNMISKKQIHENKRVIYRHLQDVISSDMKINSSTEGSHLVRNLCNTTPKDIHWRKIRSYLMSNDCQLESQADGKVSLKIGGYLKGRPMSVNSLVHVVGVGAGRIDSFEIPSNGDPFDRSHKDEGKSLPAFMIQSDIEQQDDLTMEARADGLMGEQTWPTEDEMNGMVDDSGGLRKNMRNIPSDIPEGMSSYQADWLVNDEGEWEDELVDPTKDTDEMGVINEEDNQSIIEDQEDDVDDFGGSVLDSAMNVNAAIEEKRRLQSMVRISIYLFI
jgi:pre-rRNA-processing protein TSR1